MEKKKIIKLKDKRDTITKKENMWHMGVSILGQLKSTNQIHEGWPDHFVMSCSLRQPGVTFGSDNFLCSFVCRYI